MRKFFPRSGKRSLRPPQVHQARRVGADPARQREGRTHRGQPVGETEGLAVSNQPDGLHARELRKPRQEVRPIAHLVYQAPLQRGFDAEHPAVRQLAQALRLDLP
ncbi:hypothetical protein RZS08_22330, partial [Arthrospira platensis SPKY1]|nr:hypothetical protein [Arthrospira platensis SPKY1]